MVGISLLTLVPGEVGGAETSARGLCRGLARAGTLDYTAFTPPAAPGAGGGLREVQVPEYRAAHTIPQRLLAMGLAAAHPGASRRRLRPPPRASPPGGRAARPLPLLPGAPLAAQEPRAAVRGIRPHPPGAARARARPDRRGPRGTGG